MQSSPTEFAISTITDPALFERLATAILRSADSTYGSIAHGGVNQSGRTIPAPIDCIGFMPHAAPAHLILVQHTTCALRDLRHKWLHEPSDHSSRPAGDVIKAIRIVQEERRNTPDMLATIVLTSSVEPPERLIRSVHAVARRHRICIDLWSRSRLVDYLDHNPAGQWIRKTFLGIEQQLLSPELLHSLSEKSLAACAPLDDAALWVDRSIDSVMASLPAGLTFLVADSGLGKSVACFRWLTAHVASGGFGLVLSDRMVDASPALDEAVFSSLHELHPTLSRLGPSPRGLCSARSPLLLVVEDINRSGHPAALIEKLIRWADVPAGQNRSSQPWLLICPLWPDALFALSERLRKRVDPLVVPVSRFSPAEGQQAVLKRASGAGVSLTPLQANEVSIALGHDPLLLALHEYGDHLVDPHYTVALFVERALTDAVVADQTMVANEFRMSLRALGAAMLLNRELNPCWDSLKRWAQAGAFTTAHIARLAHQTNLLRFSGPSDAQRLTFRHDRVCRWVLEDAADDLWQRGLLPEDVLGDPFFAEVMGSLLVRRRDRHFVACLADTNPLALFHALRLLPCSDGLHSGLVARLEVLVEDSKFRSGSHDSLRWEALGALASADCSAAVSLVRRFPGRSFRHDLALIRNGDISGGVRLCSDLDPSIFAPWRDAQLDHAQIRHGTVLIEELRDRLECPDSNDTFRRGAVVLAGHFADPVLAPALEACWKSDSNRADRLDAYLWAFGHCASECPRQYLNPVCDVWASLSDSSPDCMPSPRMRISIFGSVRGFRQWPPPESVIDFFIERGKREDLKQPVLAMLDGVDTPNAVSFQVEEIAAVQRRIEGTSSFSPWAHISVDQWRRRGSPGCGRAMSSATRRLLLSLWRNEGSDRFLRRQAFLLWEASRNTDDLRFLRESPPPGLEDSFLRARLDRGDLSAIPKLIDRLSSHETRWWHAARGVWPHDLLLPLMEETLRKRGAEAQRIWGESLDLDDVLSDLIIRLPEVGAERLLLSHWDHLRFGPPFIQAALYVGTPSLRGSVEGAVKTCPSPNTLFQFLSQRYGILMHGHPGLTRESQIRALQPYVNLIHEHDLAMLWDACNEHGWYETRRSLLDPVLPPPYAERIWNKERAATQLDQLVGKPNWVLDWVDRVMHTGVTWSEVLETVFEWFDARQTWPAFDVLAELVSDRGTRADLRSLAAREKGTQQAIQDAMENAVFAVFRRSPH